MRHLPFTTKNYSTAVGTAAALQLLYALPHADHFEIDQDPNALRDEILRTPLYTLEDGMAAPGEVPGLGLDLDDAALQSWRMTS
jgi:L-alanine-DL-glutamate epimerase-like enolase superfamily enzyme